MFRWIPKIGFRSHISDRMDEAELILQNVKKVLLNEQDAAIYLYGDVIYDIVNKKSKTLKISPTSVIFGRRISWRDLMDLENDWEIQCLMEVKLINYDLPEEKVREQAAKVCCMILTVHYNLLAIKRQYTSDLRSEMVKCSDLYLGLVSELYLIGSGESNAEEFRVRLSSILQKR